MEMENENKVLVIGSYNGSELMNERELRLYRAMERSKNKRQIAALIHWFTIAALIVCAYGIELLWATHDLPLWPCLITSVALIGAAWAECKTYRN